MRPFLYLVLYIVTCTQAHAGAWLQPVGHGQYIVQTTYFSSTAFYNRSGTEQAQPRFAKREVQPYLEYGIAPNITIGGSFAAQQLEQSETANQGIGDPELFARTVIWQSDQQLLTLQPLLKLRSRYTYEAPPRGGSSSTDAELSLLYGRNLWILSPRDYTDARLGYRVRGNRLHDQWRADLALGIEIAPHLQLIPAIRYTQATSLGDATSFSENGDQDYNLTKLEIGALYRVNETYSIGLTASDHIAGRQTGNGQGITLSLAQRF